MSQQEILTITEIIDGINRVATKYHGIKSVMLIGSYAHNTATSESDIDLVIDLENEFDSKCYFNFWEDVEGIFEREVDLLTFDGVRHSVLKEDLLHGGVVLYGKA